jgi:lipocalin
MGLWYEIYRFKQTDEDNYKCIQAVYKPFNSTAILVNNSGYNM